MACSCARHGDGSVTTSLCSQHAKADPCATMAAVTGTRRRGSIKRGTCSACGWSDCGLMAGTLDVGGGSDHWIAVSDGAASTFTSWSAWVDALFALGITNPGSEGFMVNADGTTTTWGTGSPQKEG